MALPLGALFLVPNCMGGQEVGKSHGPGPLGCSLLPCEGPVTSLSEGHF